MKRLPDLASKDATMNTRVNCNHSAKTAPKNQAPRVAIELDAESLADLFAGGNANFPGDEALSFALNVMEHVGQELQLFGESELENLDWKSFSNRLWRLGKQLDAAQVVAMALRATQAGVSQEASK